MRPTAPPPAPSVAYLVSQYPHLSHEFIAREVRALRRQGVHVRTFSVRATPPGELYSDGDRAEHASTTVLLERYRAVLAAAARTALRHPAAFLHAVRAAVAAGHGSPRRILWQLFYLAEAALFCRLLRTEGIRHVHTHFANNGADVARLTVLLGQGIERVPWSWSLAMHGPTEFADVKGSDLAAKVRSARFVACISDFCRSQLMALVDPEHWDKLHVVRMTADTTRYPDRSAEPRADGPMRVLFVGRMVPEKGPQQLLDAVQRLPRGTVTVRVVGGGRLTAQVRDQIRRTGIADDVTLTGPIGQDDLPAQYAWADVFCLPSVAEGLPVVLMEAMSSGLPVVSTRIAGIPELVEDGVTGLLVPPGRPDLVRATLERLARDPQERRKLGAEAARAVRRLHDPVTEAGTLIALLTAAERGHRIDLTAVTTTPAQVRSGHR